MENNFRRLFCERFACSEQEYEGKVFWKCVYRHALPLAFVLIRAKPLIFREDFDLVREIGNARCRREIIGELNRFYGRNLRDQNGIRKLLLVRVSGKRLLQLQRKIFAEPPRPCAGQV